MSFALKETCVSISALKRHKPDEKGSLQHGENGHLWTDSSVSGKKEEQSLCLTAMLFAF